MQVFLALYMQFTKIFLMWICTLAIIYLVFFLSTLQIIRKGDNAWKIFMYLMKNAKNLDNQNKAMNLTGAIPQGAKSAKFSIIGIVTLQKNEIFSYI